MKIYNLRKKLCLLYCFLFGLCFVGSGYAQITISTPSIAFTQACASASFNTYNFSFSFFPVQNLGASNQFIVELSDRNGSFTNPVIVKTLTNTTSPVSSNFNLPTDTYGEGYRIRVRSTNPVKVSPNSNAFAAYYAVHNQAFSINGNNSTVTLCGAEDFLLQIDNNGTSASPLYYPALNYKWYKNFIEVPGERGPSLLVSQPGSYYVIVDYGTCVMNSYSNIVQVQAQSPISPVIQAENNSTAICPNSTRTLTSVLQNAGYTYKWYKNNNLIPGATNPTYAATEEGIYHLEITVAGCTFESNPIALEVIDFNLSLSTPSQIVMIPGETITVNTITDAQNPQFQWHKNNSVLPGATQAALNITQAGDYTVSVTEAQPCNITKESSVSVVYPLDFDLEVQTGAGYVSCASTATTLSIAQFDAITQNNTISLMGNSYNYSYQWYKNGSTVAGATTSSLTINSPADNGNYVLKITIPDFGVITSNILAVNLALENIAITTNGPFCENGTVLLSSNVTNTAYSYQWFKNDIAIAGAVSSTHTATEEGNYYLIATSGTCTKQSNTVGLQIPTFTVTATSPAIDILIPGEQKTLSVATDAVAPQFAWFRNNDPIPGANQSSYIATQNGTYKVVVTQNQGCLVQKEKVFVLEYPTGFEVTIAPQAGYMACGNGPAVLSITRFIANTSQGIIDLTNRANSYAYQWLKNTSPVTGATGTSHTITGAAENGSYTLSITLPDFAPVVSNAIDVKLSPENTTISSSGALCEGSSVTLSSTVTNPAYSYQWYKNDNPIPGANSGNYIANSEGNYYLIISHSGCTRQSNAITLTIQPINIASTSPATDIILPGETKTLSVTTDAAAPQFAWFRNDDPIPGANQSSYTATQNGTYKVIVTQTQGCNATAEKIFVLEYPTGFDVTIAPETGYTDCGNGPVTLSITRFIANTSQGIIDLTNRPNNYAYQWLKNTSPVTGAMGTSHTITGAAENGSYTLSITLPDFAPVISNAIDIKLSPENTTISSSGALCEGSNVTLSSTVTNPAYSYQWYKNDNPIPGATSDNHIADTEGNYYLIISHSSCTRQSNTTTLTIGQINVSSTSPATDIILPGETKTLSVTTDAASPQFAWFRNDDPIPGANQSSYTATQNGTYKVIVTQTQGCNATAEKIFVLEYPTGFDVTIAPETGYTDCGNGPVTLSITRFIANTSQGIIDLTNRANSYIYQWHKNTSSVTGATGTSHIITSAAENGSYTLSITLPDFAPVVSNAIDIKLSPEDTIISSSGALCEGSSVTLSSTVTNPAYSYQWYKNNNAIPGAISDSYIADAEGNYYLIISHSGCTKQSNAIALTIGQISIASTSPATDIILPGETKILSVTTDAASPQFAWFRNGDPIPGANQSSYSATQNGTYKVVVTQTQGCNATAEKVFVLEYPTGFDSTISANSDYQQCSSTSITLSLSSLIAIIPTGNIPVTNTSGYAFQWFKNGDPVVGAIVSSLTLNNPSENGTYKLQITLPDFAPIVSNDITVNLFSGQPLFITAVGQLCPENPQITISSNFSDSSYTYTWFKNGDEIGTGNNTNFTATEIGTYKLTVNTGSCTFESNTLQIQESDFNLTPNSPLTDTIIPGQVKTLSITTDALQPTIDWFRYDIQISNSNSSSFAVNRDGDYKAVVRQTQGCDITKETVFNLRYPNEMNVTIAVVGDFQQCNSTTATLSIASFNAIAPGGSVSVLNNTYNYQYQWLKSGQPVPGATATSLTLNNPNDIGSYTLQVTIPDYTVILSNAITVNLSFASEVVISTNDILCSSESAVTMRSNVNNPEYTYKWYKQGNTTVIGTESSLTVNTAGNYFLVVSYLDCTVTSNTLEVVPFDMSQITVDSPRDITLIIGTSITLTASGAHSYEWYFNDAVVSNSPSVTIEEPGTYKLIAKVGGCQVTKEFIVTGMENNMMAIPNVVTPNGDGINDTWNLPTKYVNNQNVEVVIYGPDGAIVFRSTRYLNNWPESSFTYSLKNPVYYYTIMEGNKITERGSITIVK
ncbi:gliding motility-associated-like protein [Flavobacterium sp. 28YEA47A]|uniref:T9SS type B sorting domain-containing protein n=1 Tax=Flavobacterium sp. 28YEA47A TaxID=3156276 RepID=UPI003514F8A3